MVREVVSGVSANANRTDKNLTARTQKVMNYAKIQNASGGTYGSRQALQGLAQGAPTAPVGGPAMALGAGGDQGSTQTPRPVGPPSDIFAPTTHGLPLSHGGPGGPGQNGTNQIPVDAPDQGSILARAMLAANPQSRMLFSIVEAYNELRA